MYQVSNRTSVIGPSAVGILPRFPWLPLTMSCDPCLHCWAFASIAVHKEVIRERKRKATGADLIGCFKPEVLREYLPLVRDFMNIPSLADLPNPGIEPASSALQADSLPTELSGKPTYEYKSMKFQLS